MGEKIQSGRIAWVCGYPAHYFRQLHRAIEQSYGRETQFFYLRRPTVEKEARDYEMGALPENAILVDANDFAALNNQLRAFDPAVVVISGYYPSILAKISVWARLTGRKTCYISDANFAQQHRRQNWRRLAKRFAMRVYLRQMSLLLCIGTENRAFYEWCCGPGWVKKRSVDFPLPHDPAPFWNEFGLTERDNQFTILYLGRLSNEKGLTNLIQALPMLPQQTLGQLRCILAGDGPARPELQKLVVNLRLQNVVDFMGSVPSDQTPRTFQMCDLFVLPSSEEPWGLVVNEALSAGKPVLAPKWIGAATDLLHDGVSGFVIPDNAPSSIAAGLERAFQSRMNLQKMGLSGRDLIISQQWSLAGTLRGWDEMASKLGVHICAQASFAPQARSESV